MLINSVYCNFGQARVFCSFTFNCRTYMYNIQKFRRLLNLIYSKFYLYQRVLASVENIPASRARRCSTLLIIYGNIDDILLPEYASSVHALYMYFQGFCLLLFFFLLVWLVWFFFLLVVCLVLFLYCVLPRFLSISIGQGFFLNLHDVIILVGFIFFVLDYTNMH